MCRYGNPENHLKHPLFFRMFGIFPALLMGACISCSFDYGSSSSENDGKPDIIMNEVEYVRVRDGEPMVRFSAEYAERYENRNAMELRHFSFEQFDSGSEDINAVGKAGAASVEMDTGNVQLREGVNISVDSEDIIIDTRSLDWKDKERFISSGETDTVHIQRSDGTTFSGQGFSADVRARTWSFTAPVAGTYVHEDDEDEEEATPGADETEDGAADNKVADESGDGAEDRTGPPDLPDGEAP